MSVGHDLPGKRYTGKTLQRHGLAASPGAETVRGSVELASELWRPPTTDREYSRQKAAAIILASLLAMLLSGV